MSLFDGLNSIRRERAALERDRVVIGSMVEDAAISESIVALGSDFFEDASEEELNDIIDKIPVDDSDIDRQVDRVLASDTDMDVDDILGIDIEDDEKCDSCDDCDGEECDVPDDSEYDNDYDNDDDIDDDLGDLDFDD